MNHYPHHIGDFNNATRHLSRLERSVYRDMLDMYYDAETALDGSDFNRLAKRLLCVTADEIAALQFVLEEFFEHGDDGHWVHERCERELGAFRAQQANNGVVKGNEKQRQSRSRARRSAIFSALRAAGESPAFNTKVADLLRMCNDLGIAVPTAEPVTVTDTARAVTRHAHDTGMTRLNQNQNHNHIKPPNPPDGGAVTVTGVTTDPTPNPTPPPKPGDGAGLAVATALCAHFPEHRRIRIADVAALVASLEADGTATGTVLLAAAALQSERLARDGGKACPSVLRWLREHRWLDATATPPPAVPTPPPARQFTPEELQRNREQAAAARAALGIVTRWPTPQQVAA